MHSLILGAAGMIGRKLTARLLADGGLARLTLADVVETATPAAPGVDIRAVTGDLSSAGLAQRLVADRPDTIFHLASIVSGEAEADLEKGYRVNLDGIRHLLDAIRAEGEKAPYRPRVVFTSSIAVFGAPFPDKIDDEFLSAPLTSYGTQKAMCELLLADYSRRGIIDGIGIRLPTICVRPGKPNLAASGFFSNIIREPLVGRDAVLPVPEDVRHWFASPRSAIGFLIHAATMDLEAVGPRRNLSLPGISVTVGEQIEALRRAAGDRAVALIRREADPTIGRIVEGWPRDFDTRRALALGFRADASFDEIIRCHIEDELGGRIGG